MTNSLILNESTIGVIIVRGQDCNFNPCIDHSLPICGMLKAWRVQYLLVQKPKNFANARVKTMWEVATG
jgi:hypothetical protein